MVNFLCIPGINCIDHYSDKYLCNTTCQRFTKVNSFNDFGRLFSKMAATIPPIPICTHVYHLQGDTIILPIKR